MNTARRRNGHGWHVGDAFRSFRVGGDLDEVIHLALTVIVKAPVVIDAGVEAPILLVELCSAERGVARIAQEVRELLAESLLNLRGSLQEARHEGISQTGAHVPVGSGHAWRRSLS